MEDGEISSHSEFSLLRELKELSTYHDKRWISTKWGSIFVAIQGDASKMPMFTYPDLGFNHITNFQNFFSKGTLHFGHFCIYHLHAPGQERHADDLSGKLFYPTMDQLAELIVTVMQEFNILHFIGFGQGFGANVLSRFALRHPEAVDGLFLINATSSTGFLAECGLQKLTPKELNEINSLPQKLENFLLRYHLGKNYETRSPGLAQLILYYINSSLNTKNLMKMIEAYVSGADLAISRYKNAEGNGELFSCSVFLLAGSLSPLCQSTVNMSSSIEPSLVTCKKLSQCSLPLEERPSKVMDIFDSYVQDLGHALGKPLGLSA